MWPSLLCEKSTEEQEDHGFRKRTMTDKQNRTGHTITTSVSVSKEFQKLVDKYELSPTECFRRGVAVTLHDMGVGQYQSEINKQRSDYVKEFLKTIAEDEEMALKSEDVEHLKILLKEINNSYAEIKKIAERWKK